MKQGALIRLDRLFPWQTYANGSIQERVPTRAEVFAWIEANGGKDSQAHKDIDAWARNPLYERPGLWVDGQGNTLKKRSTKKTRIHK